jgi:hypothetical protein
MHVEIDSLVFFVFLITYIATPALMVTNIAWIESAIFYNYFVFILWVLFLVRLVLILVFVWKYFDASTSKDLLLFIFFFLVLYLLSLIKIHIILLYYFVWVSIYFIFIYIFWNQTHILLFLNWFFDQFQSRIIIWHIMINFFFGIIEFTLNSLSFKFIRLIDLEWGWVLLKLTISFHLRWRIFLTQWRVNL